MLITTEMGTSQYARAPEPRETTNGRDIMATTKRYQVAATNGIGVEDRITRPMPLADARRVCREKRERAYYHGMPRVLAAKAYVVLAAK